jgi:hypothetical protein
MSELESSNNEQFFTDYCLGELSIIICRTSSIDGNNFPVIPEGKIRYPS